MTQLQNNNWNATVKIALGALILNILAIVYMGVIQNQQMKSTIITHTEQFVKVDSELKRLEDVKINRDLFNQLYLQGTETRLDIKDLRIMLIQHINK